MDTKSTLNGGREVGAPTTSTPPDSPDTRDRLAVRSARMDERFPKALDLEADILNAMRPELRGVASILSGIQDPTKFRAWLLGDDRSIPLYEICRLATSDRPEAGRAVDALLTVLAAARGKTLAPIPKSGVQIGDAIGTLAREFGDVVAQVTSAASDGRYNGAELDTIEREVREMQDAGVRLHAAVRHAREASRG